MRKRAISLVVVALLFIGCQKPEFEFPLETKINYSAQVESFGYKTKTALNSEEQVVWVKEDMIDIYQGMTIPDLYELNEDCAGSTNGSFDWVSRDNSIDSNGEVMEIPCNVAFYPTYSTPLEVNIQDGAINSYSIKSFYLGGQVYVPTSFGNYCFPMIAVTKSKEDHNLKFKNVMGAIKLSLKGTMIVTKIEVIGNNGEKLSGDAIVTAYADNLNPTITMLDDADVYVCLYCDEGVQLNRSEATDFYIAVPPVHFEKGFSVKVTDAADHEYIMTAGHDNAVYRSSILVMPEVTLESKEDNTPRDYVDEYGVNHGSGVKIDGVVWAPVNCGYHATDYKWGKLYQWGRKYGQGYGNNLDDVGDDATTPIKDYAPVSLSVGNDESNSNIFYYDEKNWLKYGGECTLWNSGTEEVSVRTEYDPCPGGWRVPTYNELKHLCMNRSSWITTKGHLKTCFLASLASELPFAME